LTSGCALETDSKGSFHKKVLLLAKVNVVETLIDLETFFLLTALAIT